MVSSAEPIIRKLPRVMEGSCRLIPNSSSVGASVAPASFMKASYQHQWMDISQGDRNLEANFAPRKAEIISWNRVSDALRSLFERPTYKNRHCQTDKIRLFDSFKKCASFVSVRLMKTKKRVEWVHLRKLCASRTIND